MRSLAATAHSFVRAPALLLASAMLQLLGACGGGGGSEQSAAAASGNSTVAPMTTQAWSGHYVGAVNIAEGTYFGDAVLTQDGKVRVYIGGPYDNGGELQMTRPESSEQFVGSIGMSAGQLSGSGLLIGQECATNTPNRFCAQPAPAQISATVQTNTDGNGGTSLRGELRVTTLSGTETWPLALMLWSGLDSTHATSSAAAGQYQELLADFGSGGDVIMNIDSSGNLSFQSASSGCVGNGALVPHLDGAADSYDVTLTMEDCNGLYGYLNGQYGGLALYTSSSYWDYDSLLRMWLSKPTGETRPAALTTLGEPL